MIKRNLPHRKQLRLRNYDYSQAGYYFVTICTHNRQHLFGEVIGSEMALNEYGKIVWDEWLKSAEIRKEIQIDKFVVMPNHIHAILVISTPLTVGPYGYTAENQGTEKRTYCHTSLRSPSRNVGAMIRGFKSSVTLRINIARKTPQNPVWQSNYYDHIIRNKQEYQKIREYIDTNPLKWQDDKYFL